MNSSAVLVDRFLEGDKSAFDQLIANHYGYCLSRAMYLVKHTELAKDLTQDALIQAYTNIEKLKDYSAFKAWLGGIVRNVCNSHLRSNKQKGSFSLDDRPEHQSDNSHDWEQENEEQSIKFRLKTAIEKLKDNQKEVIEAFYFEGRSIDDIAKSNDLKISTVKVRLYRARKRLRTLMNINNTLGTSAMIGSSHVYIWNKSTSKNGKFVDWEAELWDRFVMKNLPDIYKYSNSPIMEKYCCYSN